MSASVILPFGPVPLISARFRPYFFANFRARGVDLTVPGVGTALLVSAGLVVTGGGGFISSGFSTGPGLGTASTCSDSSPMTAIISPMAAVCPNTRFLRSNEMNDKKIKSV